MMRSLLVGLILCACGPVFAVQPKHAFQLTSLYHVGFWVRDIAKSRAFYHDFLGYDEPYELRRPNGDLQLAVLKVNERQVIYLFPDATKILPNGDNLDHLGLETNAIEAARTHLLAHDVKVGAVNRGRIGDFLLGVKDPDGHTWELTQFAPEGQLLQHQGQALTATRIAAKLRSATLTVADLNAALHFYVDVLGCTRVHAEGVGPAGASVRVQLPEGEDYLELAPYEWKTGAAAARAVPEYCLEVDDIAKTFATLDARAKQLGLPPPTPITTSYDGLRQTSVVDPDGTRVVLKEGPRA